MNALVVQNRSVHLAIGSVWFNYPQSLRGQALSQALVHGGRVWSPSEANDTKESRVFEFLMPPKTRATSRKRVDTTREEEEQWTINQSIKTVKRAESEVDGAAPPYPLASYQSLYPDLRSRFAGLTDRAPADDNMTTNTNPTDNEMYELRERIAQLEALVERRTERQTITPASSHDTDNRSTRTQATHAIRGADFRPTGFAALDAFQPYGHSQNSSNPDYDRKAKKGGIDPGVFDGNKAEFDKWIIKVADKMEEDNVTYKKERSRMAVLTALTKGSANDMLEGRYRST